jgi:WD40 repeat protein
MYRPPDIWTNDKTSQHQLWIASFSFRESEIVYDFDIYPWLRVTGEILRCDVADRYFSFYASRTDPETCCIITCTKDHPIGLWHLLYGKRVGSYSAYNDKDELVTPLTAVFDPSGERIYAGYDSCLRIFRVVRPGRECEELRLTPSRRSKEGLKGRISSIAFSPEEGGRMYAVGCYSGKVGIYSEASHEPFVIFDSQHVYGVSQIAFSPEGYYFISSGRKDDWVTVWDLRMTGRELYHLERPMKTHQRTRFSIQRQQSLLMVGDQVSHIELFDMSDHPHFISLCRSEWPY